MKVACDAIKVEKCLSWDVHTGTKEALIAAGIAADGEFPGDPGAGKTMCTFFNGRRIRQGTNGKRDERYKQVRRGGGAHLFQVFKGISEEEHQRRRAKEERAAATWPFPPSEEPKVSEEYRASFNAAGMAFFLMDGYRVSPARFHVGERAIFCVDGDDDGSEVEIIKDYGCHDVVDLGQCLGYVVRDEDGDRFFAQAGQLLRFGYKPGHLCLVQRHA